MNKGVATVRLKRGIHVPSWCGAIVTEDMIERRWHVLAWYRICDAWYWICKKVRRP